MIDVKQAVQLAKQQAEDMLGENNFNLEEIERGTSKNRDIWIITQSFPVDIQRLPPLSRIAAAPFQYKRFLIDVETGELVAMLLREPANR